LRRGRPAMARRTNDAPTRESRSRVRPPPARRPPPVDRAFLLHTHASIGCQRAWFPNADRPTRRAARRWGDGSSPWDGHGPILTVPGLPLPSARCTSQGPSTPNLAGRQVAPSRDTAGRTGGCSLP
jgi:hypothetical protein